MAGWWREKQRGVPGKKGIENRFPERIGCRNSSKNAWATQELKRCVNLGVSRNPLKGGGWKTAEKGVG